MTDTEPTQPAPAPEPEPEPAPAPEPENFGDEGAGPDTEDAPNGAV
jgi:hypothetical protein